MLGPKVPELLGGSADLTGSNLTDFPGCGAVRGGEPGGRHINYGVREFGMAAIMNGMALHGGFIPYGGTFLTFSDYSRNAVRMAALMKLRVIHVFTHDSIGLGEDGPTHQPVEHAATLRLIPNLDVWRPGDAAETAVAWVQSISERATRPSALAAVAPEPAGAAAQRAAAGRPRGARRLCAERARQRSRRDPRHRLGTGPGDGRADAAGCEGHRRARGLDPVDHGVRPPGCRLPPIAVLGTGVPRIAVEAGVTRFWGQYGCVAALGIDTFGESAPAGELFKHFGLTAANLADTVAAQL